jgi:hypothetical protein
MFFKVLIIKIRLWKNIFNTRSFISFITLAQGPEFEVYTGITIPNVDNGNGHIIGLNVTPNFIRLINIILIKIVNT